MSDDDLHYDEFDDDIFVSEEPEAGPRRPPRHDRGREEGDGNLLQVDDGPSPNDQYFDDDDDYVELPSHEKLPRWVLVVGVFILIVGTIAGGASYWYDRQLNPSGGHGDVVPLTIHRDTSIGSMGDVLASNDVITNSMLFNFWASRKGLGTAKAGTYLFNENMSFDEARAVLERGPCDPATDERCEDKAGVGEITKVLIPEGLAITQVQERIADKVDRFSVEGLQQALDSGEVTSSLQPDGESSFEGLLFPATYDVGSNESEVVVLQKLATEMQTRVSNLNPQSSLATINERYDLDLSTYDVIIVASMVQAEAANADEASTVASVIYNRLAGLDPSIPTLGIDAVDRYGANLEGVTLTEYWQTDGPYNTREHAGLPPTPISAPGPWALEAAFAPADTGYFWYVLVDEGVHSFNETKAAHDRDKAICRSKGLCDA